MAANTYSADIKFLKKFTPVVELKGSGDARVAVAPQFAGRVMTSTLAGGEGASFGWLNAAFIESGKKSPTFNNYGGEDRFWMGPEAGQYALFFKKGEPFDIAHAKTPSGFDKGGFEVTSQGAKSIAMAASFKVTNYAGTTFNCAVKRVINVLTPNIAAAELGAAIPTGVNMVGFESVNTLANAGKTAWTTDGGLLSIWILGQFKPLPEGKVIVPFIPSDDMVAFGPKATTDYFGRLPSDRCHIGYDHMLFSCDGHFRSKIGVSPRRAKNVIGSYDPAAKVLTIVQFNMPCGAAKLPYVNSLWQIQDKPFAGDVINSYNDGEERPGMGSFGSFYEIETLSPAAIVKSNDAIIHVHRTFHFAGDLAGLKDIAMRVLGADLCDILI